MPSLDVVVMLRAATSGISLADLRDELAVLWNRLLKDTPLN